MLLCYGWRVVVMGDWSDCFELRLASLAAWLEWRVNQKCKFWPILYIDIQGPLYTRVRTLKVQTTPY
jgi:hypothetical protein